MSLLQSTLLLSALMIAAGAFPLLSKRVSRHSKSLLLFGTGAMLGLCVFGLVPEIVTVGGVCSFLLIAATSGIYSWVHVAHVTHHHHEGDGPGAQDNTAVGFLVGSMSLHCLADGIVLAISSSVSMTMARTIFFALTAHKGYEAFNVSALLKEKARSQRQLLAFLALYTLSFPAGVGITLLTTRGLRLGSIPFWVQGLPILIMSIAVGGLLGCLLHDFLIPSLHRIRHRRGEVLWLILGLGLSSILGVGV